MARKKGEKNRRTTMQRNQMSPEGSPDISPSLPNELIQLKDIIQVKVNTDERIQNVEKTVQKILNRRKKDLCCMLKEDRKKVLIDEIKEDLKRELIDEVKEDLKRELIDEVKEDLKTKLIDEVKEDLKRDLIDEVNKDLIGEVNKIRREFLEYHPRNQSTQMQKARFRLRINCEVISPAYKGKPIQTRESDGRTVVELYEGDSVIGPNHPLASVAVQLVVVNQEFEGIEGHWSKQYFEDCIIKTNPVKDGRFVLVDGRCRHKGAVIKENSNRKEVKLGVMIVDMVDTRVLEGVSKPFKVQEAKTESTTNRGKRTEPTNDVWPTIMDNPSKRPHGAGPTEDLLSNLQDQQNSLQPTQQFVNFATSMWNPPRRGYMSTQEAGTPQVYRTTQLGTPQPENQGVPTPGFNGFLPNSCNVSGPTAPFNPPQRSDDVNHWSSEINFGEALLSPQLNPLYHWFT